MLPGLLVGLAGCGTELGGTCGLTDPCGDGTVCDLTAPGVTPGSGVCVDAKADEDGDGLPNQRDFCQHQAGGEFDEDLDGVGDDCDACPIAPPPVTPDSDGDTVDSPCDPDPSTAGDRIVAFSGFDGPIPTSWKATAGWTIQGGQAVATPGGPTTVETLTTALPLSSAHVAVLARYRVDRVDTTATENAASVLALDRRPAGLVTISCGGSRSGGSDRLLLDTSVSTAAKNLTQLFDSAGLYRLAAKVDGAQAACAVIANTETGAVQTTATGDAPTEAGIAAKGATVRFDYLLAIQRAP